MAEFEQNSMYEGGEYSPSAIAAEMGESLASVANAFNSLDSGDLYLIETLDGYAIGRKAHEGSVVFGAEPQFTIAAALHSGEDTISGEYQSWSGDRVPFTELMKFWSGSMPQDGNLLDPNDLPALNFENDLHIANVFTGVKSVTDAVLLRVRECEGVDPADGPIFKMALQLARYVQFVAEDWDVPVDEMAREMGLTSEDVDKLFEGLF